MMPMLFITQRNTVRVVTHVCFHIFSGLVFQQKGKMATTATSKLFAHVSTNVDATSGYAVTRATRTSDDVIRQSHCAIYVADVCAR